MADKEWTPTDNQKAFVEDVIETSFKNITESYRKAYPESHTKYASVEAYRLLRNPKIKALIEQIQHDLRQKFVLVAPEALQKLIELSQSADSEKVQLEASLELLDRAGLVKVQKVEFSPLGVFGSLDPEDIKKQIRERQQESEQRKLEVTKAEA